jgi:hypothetical protein
MNKRIHFKKILGNSYNLSVNIPALKCYFNFRPFGVRFCLGYIELFGKEIFRI